MPKLKKIIALTFVALLLCLYLITFIFSILDRSETMYLFKASLFSTFGIPVLLYVFILFYRILKKDEK